jgi:hypothetical protein
MTKSLLRSTNDFEMSWSISEPLRSSFKSFVFVLVPKLADLIMFASIEPQSARSVPLCGVPKKATPRIWDRRFVKRSRS